MQTPRLRGQKGNFKSERRGHFLQGCEGGIAGAVFELGKDPGRDVGNSFRVLLLGHTQYPAHLTRRFPDAYIAFGEAKIKRFFHPGHFLRVGSFHRVLLIDCRKIHPWVLRVFFDNLLVPYYLVFCHKKQENLCVFAPLREAIWVAGIARVRQMSLTVPRQVP